MDNHPIPQDVTGFQFRLIGDMTIKQFAYLAAGVILAWICLSLPIFFLAKLPLVLFFGGSGVLFAFIPIGGRPADTMILYFFKAVFSQTQYTYQATQAQPMQAQPMPTTMTGGSPVKMDEKKEEKEEKVQLAQPAIPAAYEELFAKKEEKPAEQPVQQAPTMPTIGTTEDTNQNHIVQEATALTEALQEAKKEEVVAKAGTEEAAEAHKKVADLETELQSLMTQKQALESRLMDLQKQLQQKPQQVFTPTAAQPTATENVRKIPASMGKAVGTPFVTDVPNLIGGIVKDSRGNVLPNILIEVKDKDGNPVRAFKTNPLGQFASATPVINGVYTITFEDPNSKQRFDTVELTANGEVLEPIEVISVDAREDLRKELFGG